MRKSRPPTQAVGLGHLRTHQASPRRPGLASATLPHEASSPARGPASSGPSLAAIPGGPRVQLPSPTPRSRPGSPQPLPYRAPREGRGCRAPFAPPLGETTFPPLFRRNGPARLPGSNMATLGFVPAAAQPFRHLE